MDSTKTALLMPEPQNDFQIKNMVPAVPRNGNRKHGIQTLYMQGILYPKEPNHQQLKNL